MCIANYGFRLIGSGAGVLGWFVVYGSDRNREVLHIKLRNEYYMYGWYIFRGDDRDRIVAFL